MTSSRKWSNASFYTHPSAKHHIEEVELETWDLLHRLRHPSLRYWILEYSKGQPKQRKIILRFLNSSKIRMHRKLLFHHSSSFATVKGLFKDEIGPWNELCGERIKDAHERGHEV
uniref:Uncharacterized protein n=1 Tax=Tanacetum cinerariifolium TaxID=118510 RepID=A0A6L2JQ71_TANCI|nr:hypothetical protein [Tanacetum cinerariifolium]